MAQGGPPGSGWPGPSSSESLGMPPLLSVKNEGGGSTVIGHIGGGGLAGGSQVVLGNHVVTVKEEPRQQQQPPQAPSLATALGGVGMGGMVVGGGGDQQADASIVGAETDADGAVDPEAIYGQSFADFVQSLDEFTPTIPDAVTSYYMNAAGFQIEDARLLRLISLSCQKFIADVTNDAMQHCKIRTAQQIKNQKQTKPRFQLTLEDLLPTLKERGISIKKPHYFL